MSGELDLKGGRATGLKAQILAADDRPYRDEVVPEWDVKIRVRGLSGTERDAYEAKLVQVRNAAGTDVELRLQDFRSRLVVKCLYDPETDERIFEDGEVSKLGAKSGAVIDRLFDVCQELSGMDSEAVSRAEGNSGTGPSVSSTIA